MIESKYEISNEDGYIKYNNFIVSDGLKDILSNDYEMYGSSLFNKEELCEKLYKLNFYDKYDEDANELVYSKYINNQQFKNKAHFIYSIIDYEKYKKFVAENENIENPNDLTITYNILDSDNTKVLMYSISIVDISFVF